MSSAAARNASFVKNSRIIKDFCRKYQFDLVELNNGYQLRIENALDVYPVNGRWCWLQTGERGSWETARDLRGIMLRMTGDSRMYDKPPKNIYAAPIMIFDEAANWPEYKWYRNPIKWYKSRKLMKPMERRFK